MPLADRVSRWAGQRLANRLVLWAGLLTLGTLGLSLLAGLALTRWMAGNYAASLLELRASQAAQGVERRLGELEAHAQALAGNTFVINALTDSAGRNVYLQPFLRQHLLRQQGASLRVCDSANAVIGNEGPGPSAPAGGACLEPQRVEALLKAGVAQADLVGAAGAERVRVLVPVLFPLTRTYEGVVVVSLPLAALGAEDGIVRRAARAAPVAAAGAADALDRPLRLPAASALAPLGLAVQVRLSPGTGNLPFAPVALAYAALGLLLAAGAVLLTLRLARSVVTPVNGLAALSRLASRGAPVTLPSDLDTPDELGELARAFKQMADQTGDANRRLAAQVEELVEARNAALAAGQAKSDFLAVMSHEIRTPMNAVMGLLFVSLRAPLEPAQRERLGKAHRAAQGLMRVINDILDFSKLDADKLVIAHEPYRPQVLLAEVFDTFEQIGLEKGVPLVVQGADELPPWLLGDAQRLRQVVLNLVGNAMKFTDRGQVTLRAQAVAGAQQAHERSDASAAPSLLLCVQDTGIGMSAAQQALLFQPFSQVDTSASRRHSGTGLGLAISRRLVALMGGRLWVQSEPGRGSSFFVELPLVVADDATAAAASAAQAGAPQVTAALQGATVLVVDDNEVNLLVAGEIMRSLGLRALQASDGEQALQMLHAHPEVRAVLMDCRMPKMDGYEATRRIRQHAPWRHLPVIAMTADALEQDRQVCLDAGMDDHLTKPIVIEDLQAALLRWLGANPVAPSPADIPAALSAGQGFSAPAGRPPPSAGASDPAAW